MINLKNQIGKIYKVTELSDGGYLFHGWQDANKIFYLSGLANFQIRQGDKFVLLKHTINDNEKHVFYFFSLKSCTIVTEITMEEDFSFWYKAI